MSDCILWAGCVNSKGYGVRTVMSQRVLAHRHAYAEAKGLIPAGSQLHHLCGERRCVNPDHLELVTALEHNRAHVPGRAIGDAVDELLADGEWWRPRDLAARIPGASRTAVTMMLHRAAGRGDVEHGERGFYRRAQPESRHERDVPRQEAYAS